MAAIYGPRTEYADILVQVGPNIYRMCDIEHSMRTWENFKENSKKVYVGFTNTLMDAKKHFIATQA